MNTSLLYVCNVSALWIVFLFINLNYVRSSLQTFDKALSA